MSTSSLAYWMTQAILKHGEEHARLLAYSGNFGSPSRRATWRKVLAQPCRTAEEILREEQQREASFLAKRLKGDMTHFRTFPTSELHRLTPITKRRIKNNLEGLILVDERGTVGALVSRAIVQQDFAHLQSSEKFRLNQLHESASPIHQQDWLTLGTDLIWLISNRRPILALIHPRHRNRLPIPTFQVSGGAA
jgi:hypothetical protein